MKSIPIIIELVFQLLSRFETFQNLKTGEMISETVKGAWYRVDPLRQSSHSATCWFWWFWINHWEYLNSYISTLKWRWKYWVYVLFSRLKDKTDTKAFHTVHLNTEFQTTADLSKWKPSAFNYLIKRPGKWIRSIFIIFKSDRSSNWFVFLLEKWILHSSNDLGS